jgi:hypothetical protein
MNHRAWRWLRRLPLVTVCALTAAASATAADAAWHLEPGNLTISQRVRYLLADGRHAFVDEDARRALLSLSLGGGVSIPVLGWRALVVDEALSDAGERLEPTFPLTSAVLHRRPGADFLTIGLPAGAKSYAGLARLRGHVEVVFAGAPPQHWRVPLASLPTGPTTIDGHAELPIELEPAEEHDGASALRLPLASALAVSTVALLGADGRPLKGHEPHRDRRERRHPLASDAGSQLVWWNGTLPADAVLDIEYVPVLTSVSVPFDVQGLAFGVTLPSAAQQRAGEARGANEL